MQQIRNIFIFFSILSAGFFTQKTTHGSTSHRLGSHRFIKNYTSEKRNYIMFHSDPKSLLQRSLLLHPKRERKTTLANAQNSPDQLDSIIKSALASSGIAPTIVIINKTPTLTPKITDQNFQQNTNVTNCNAPINGTRKSGPGVITFDDISGIINIANSIGAIYDNYYKIFPNKDEVMVQKNSTGIFDSTLAILSFYGKVKKFVNAVIKNSDQIKSNLKMIKTSVNQLSTSEMDMLKFLGLDNRFSQTKIRTAPYEDFDPKFHSYYMDMVDMTMDFEINVKSVLRTIANLDTYSNLFEESVKELMSIGINKYNNDFLNIVDKIDTVLMFLGSILALKDQLTMSIDTFKKSTAGLSSDRKRLSDSLDRMNNLADYYNTKSLDKQSILTIKSEWKVSVVACVFIGTLMSK